jgi:hypothetical protein
MVMAALHWLEPTRVDVAPRGVAGSNGRAEGLVHAGPLDAMRTSPDRAANVRQLTDPAELDRATFIGLDDDPVTRVVANPISSAINATSGGALPRSPHGPCVRRRAAAVRRFARDQGPAPS